MSPAGRGRNTDPWVPQMRYLLSTSDPQRAGYVRAVVAHPIYWLPLTLVFLVTFAASGFLAGLVGSSVFVALTVVACALPAVRRGIDRGRAQAHRAILLSRLDLEQRQLLGELEALADDLRVAAPAWGAGVRRMIDDGYIRGCVVVNELRRLLAEPPVAGGDEGPLTDVGLTTDASEAVRRERACWSQRRARDRRRAEENVELLAQRIAKICEVVRAVHQLAVGMALETEGEDLAELTADAEARLWETLDGCERLRLPESGGHPISRAPGMTEAG